MSRMAPSDDDEIRRLAEASAWRVSLTEADQATCDGFEAWLAGHPDNEVAWDQVQGSWSMVGDLASAPELIALRRDALARAHRRGARRWAVSNTWVARIAACLVLFLGAALLVTMWPGPQPLVYATTLGERRVITLDDGSRISLDSSTEVRVTYSDDIRRLELVNGQARFDVAHDVTRPFMVQARDRIVVATGTAFNIDLVGPRIQVTLIEGRVVVLHEDRGVDTSSAAAVHPSDRSGVALTAGQQLTVLPATAARVDTVSLDRATSWEHGVLVFEDEPLASIAERISRYSIHPVRVDPASANLRVSGVFHAGDVPTFVDTVRRYLPVRPERQADGSTLLKSAG